MIKEDTYPFSSFVTFTETSVTTNNTLAPSGTSSPPKIGAESYFHNAWYDSKINSVLSSADKESNWWLLPNSSRFTTPCSQKTSILVN